MNFFDGSNVRVIARNKKEAIKKVLREEIIEAKREGKIMEYAPLSKFSLEILYELQKEGTTEWRLYKPR